ncbi:hypothetical protein [Flavobacterium sharifuzzamanii]|uniref:hypothetical protein n=1 Tax=Flavobacterium sharifuzzamanii TaxID=2211133 RepID=UPI000DAB53A3|nr:hypothetical protein [Flavobacterium sharifuzzamanii]KAF2082357.1 hypothetical protein DMA14_03300 [Flavobacterium sharifuzzamanii]
MEDLPFETYILNIRDEKEEYFLDHLIINVKDQELISKQLIAIEADEEIPENVNYTAKSFVVNKDLTISIFEMRFSKIYKKLNEGYKITSDGKIISSKSKSENRAEANSWSGKYTFKRTNKDELVTSFLIDIKNLDDIAIVYIGDGEKAESYKNLKAENIVEDKIKIVFNKKYDELGIIYIQKNDDKYIISGEPISNINPGNDEYPLKKVN